jgi:hypothetical protein
MPRRTWRRAIEDEIRSTRGSWEKVNEIAGDRNGWKFSWLPCTPQGGKGLDDYDEGMFTIM